MNNRNSRKAIAEDTLRIVEQGFFDSTEGKRINIRDSQQAAEQYTKVYSPAMSDELIQLRLPKAFVTSTKITVTNETSLGAVRRLLAEGHEDVICLNFASAKNPGGGFLNGSQAQEESLARATGLYNCLLKAEEYYRKNRAMDSCIYSDCMIYTPNVPVFKEDNGINLNELITTSFITAPAVNAGVVRQQEPDNVNKIESTMKRRIEKVLAIALANNHLSIVLGAWGCGVFQNDPGDIARYFNSVISDKFQNEFQNIVFAIYASDTRFIEPFYTEFGQN